MSTGQSTINEAKPAWDKRALVAGILVPVTAGVCYWLCYYLRANGGWSVLVDGRQISIDGILSFFSAVLGTLSGAIASAVARRRYFLWGLSSIVIFRVIISIYDPDFPSKSDDMAGQRLIFGLYFAVIIAVATAGPNSLVRYILRRRQRKQMSMDAEPYAAPNGSDAMWPPAPAGIGQDSGSGKAK